MSTNEPDDLTDRDLRDRAVAAARGATPFDLLITGGTLFDAAIGDFRPAEIGIVGPLIASVHQPGQRKDALEQLDATGQTVTPGLIDMHMHVESSMVTPSGYASAVLPRGVTRIVWDPHELANVHGIDGVRWALDASRDLPLRVHMLAPSCVPSAPKLERAGAELRDSDIASLLDDPALSGLAEMMNMRGVIDRDDHVSGIVQAALASGKPLFGHARGLSGSDLAAFMAAGVSSDHELTSAEDLLEKLRAGLTIELRGSHDHLLPEFVFALNELGVLPSTVTLCTDDVFPDDLHDQGGLDDVVRRLVRYGLPATWALQAATLNAAMRLKRDDLGLIAAGRRADIAIFGDVEHFRASAVIANGRVAARNGRMTEQPKSLDATPLRHSVHCPALSADDFRIRSNASRVRVATIDQPRFTRWGEAETLVKAGFVVPPPAATLISVVHRHGQADPVPRTGFLTGWGQWNGAFCTTVCHDSHNLTVFGGSEDDLALAANTVIRMGGGMAVVTDGRVAATLPLPLSGLISDEPIAVTARRFATLRQSMEQVVDWQPPYLVFKACFGATLACNAGPHQTDRGIADVGRGLLLEDPVLEVLA